MKHQVNSRGRVFDQYRTGDHRDRHADDQGDGDEDAGVDLVHVAEVVHVLGDDEGARSGQT
jgi:hypothetical protein